MYPILFSWGPIVLPAWHTFYLLGAVAALILVLRMARHQFPSLPSQEIARLYAVCYVSGYLGARMLSILVEEPDVTGLLGVLAALLRLGPMTFYGGAIAAALAGSLYASWRHLRVRDLFDIFIIAGLVALALGRVGCFLNGDDYGKPVAQGSGGAAPWWAVTFPVLEDNLPRYPTQLLEAGAVTILAMILWRSFTPLRAAMRPGFVAFLGIVAYANLRFFIEFLRDDFRGSPLGTWISTSQFISIILLACAGLTLPYWIRQRRLLKSQEPQV